jgi:hypothetical protein
MNKLAEQVLWLLWNKGRNESYTQMCQLVSPSTSSGSFERVCNLHSTNLLDSSSINFKSLDFMGRKNPERPVVLTAEYMGTFITRIHVCVCVYLGNNGPSLMADVWLNGQYTPGFTFLLVLLWMVSCPPANIHFPPVLINNEEWCKTRSE